MDLGLFVMELRLRFRCPRVLIDDPCLLVLLGGEVLHEGSFMKGFDLSLRLPPGLHVLETRLVGRRGQTRRQRIEVALPQDSYREHKRADVRVGFSTISGNFEPRAHVLFR